MEPESAPPSSRTQAQVDETFAGMVRQHRQGMTNRELSDELQRVARHVMETHGTGSVNFSVKLAYGGEGVVKVAVDIKSRVPVERAEPLFFVDERGVLSRDRPHTLPRERDDFPTYRKDIEP